MVRNEDIIGKRFGKLVVKSLDRQDKKHYYFLCQCDCGNIKSIRKGSLISGNTTSCGCNYKTSNHNMQYYKERTAKLETMLQELGIAIDEE